MAWAQYNLADAMPALIQATTKDKVDPDAILAAGRGQVENNNAEYATHVDTSENPPVFMKIEMATV